MNRCQQVMGAAGVGENGVKAIGQMLSNKADGTEVVTLVKFHFRNESVETMKTIKADDV
jgi:hypothetical protein